MTQKLHVFPNSGKVLHVWEVPEGWTGDPPDWIICRCGRVMKAKNLPRPQFAYHGAQRKRHCKKCGLTVAEFKEIQEDMLNRLNAWYIRRKEITYHYAKNADRQRRMAYKVQRFAQRALATTVVPNIAALFGVEFHNKGGHTGWQCRQSITVDGMKATIFWNISTSVSAVPDWNAWDGAEQTWANTYLYGETE